MVAADRDDVEELRRLHELHVALGLDSEWLAPSRCRRLEPWLSPRIAGGLLAAGDAQADPRATALALAAAVDEIAFDFDVALDRARRRARDRRDRHPRGTIACEHVVVAAGRVVARARPGGRRCRCGP